MCTVPVKRFAQVHIQPMLCPCIARRGLLPVAVLTAMHTVSRCRLTFITSLTCLSLLICITNCCRWETKGCVVPLQLQLCSVATGQHVASLEGSVSMPWSKIQQHITILAGQDDPVWLQVVIASGLAEAKRLGGENSSTTPRRFAQ